MATCNFFKQDVNKPALVTVTMFPHQFLNEEQLLLNLFAWNEASIVHSAFCAALNRPSYAYAAARKRKWIQRKPCLKPIIPRNSIGDVYSLKDKAAYHFGPFSEDKIFILDVNNHRRNDTVKVRCMWPPNSPNLNPSDY